MVAMTLPAKPWTNGMMTADGTRMFDSTVGSEGAWRSTPVPAGGLPAGSIIQWGSNTAPPNWLICDGSAVSRALWPSLFATIGTTYGSGDGSTTFNLPDLRGRVAVGRDGSQTEFDVLGETGGAKSHSHGTTTLTAAVWAGFWKVRQASTWTATNSGGVTAPGSSSSMSNSGAAIEGYTDYNSNLSPYLVTNYIIKATTGWSAGDSELALRMAAAETAAATTNKSGLVPIKPSQLTLGAGGTASFDSNGVVTVTGVGNVYLWDVFTSLYRNYRVVVESTKITDGANYMGLQLHNAGVESAANYNIGSLQSAVNATTLTQNGTYNGGYTVLCQHYYNAGVVTATIDIFGPALASETGISGIANGKTAAIPTQNIISGQHGLATAYSGLKVLITANTWSGKVRVYGYN